jgi:DNA-binding beta-propeller fold protein YncE
MGVNRHMVRSTLILLVLLAGLCSLVGCSGGRGKVKPVFFPPEPNPPRVQFLMEISSSDDLLEEEAGISLFAVGKPQVEKTIPIFKPFGLAQYGPNVYLCDSSAGRVLVINIQARTMEPLKGDFGAGKLKRPVNVAVDDEGQIYVVDTQRRELLLYDAEGNFVKSVAKSTEMKPVDVAVSDRHIYVLDISTNTVKVFERTSHEFLREFGRGLGKDDSLALPIGMALEDDKFIHVTNGLSGKVMKFDIDGHFISSFGQMGDGFGQFARPRGITVDREGIIYVVDAAHQTVQLFNQNGRVLMFFGEAGRPRGSLNLPAGVMVSYDNLEYFQKMADPGFVLEKIVYVTSQFGKSKLGVYGFGHRKGDVPAPAMPAPKKPEGKTEEKPVETGR